MVQSSSLRILFTIAAQQNLHIKNFDVKTAFLYGTLEEDKPIHMTFPGGYEEKSKRWLLKKVLCGLKQTPFQWNKTLTSFLKSEGLAQLKTDQCIFKDSQNKLYLVIHVDNGIMMSRDPTKLNNLLYSKWSDEL